MFRSLRAKLIASYTLVILLCLLLAGSAAAYILHGYQRQLKLSQLADMVQPLYSQVRLLEQAGASQQQISRFLQDSAAEIGGRILLVDPSGLVVEDTYGELVDYQIHLPGGWEPRDRYTAFSVATFERSAREGFVFISAETRSTTPIVTRLASRFAAYRVILAVPEQSLTASWRELAPSLSIAALLSIILSVGVALVLSRSISRPIAQITHASEEMSKGNFDQHIPVRSKDEVGRLASAFNHMAGQVSASHRTLRDFLANVSHELRTPLTSIQGFSQAMMDGTVQSQEEYSRSAAIINEEAERMRRMVEDLLLLSKMESGQMPMAQSPVGLEGLLQTTIRRASPRAEAAGVTLHLAADESVQITGDEGRLEQLLSNLLDNALRHTPRGGRITLALETDDPQAAPHGDRQAGHVPRLRAVVSVHNSGSYIPPEHRSRVFERFYQVDGSRARNGDGSGLGLAIAREIALAHGAEISVDSSPELGTTFRVAFFHQHHSGDHVPAVQPDRPLDGQLDTAPLQAES